MNVMVEQVPLPNGETQPLVHPLEVAGARPAFVRAWVMSLIGSPQSLVLVGAAAWLLAEGWLAPTLAVLSTGVIAELARRHSLGEAWAHIPRRRQDRDRALPMPYRGFQQLVPPAVLVGGLVLLLAGFADHDAPVRSWAIGSAAGCSLAMIADAVWSWSTGRTLALGIDMLACLLAASTGIITAAATGALEPPIHHGAAAGGAAMVVAAWALVTARVRASRLKLSCSRTSGEALPARL